MTENEAIKQLQVGYLGDTEDLVQAKHIAIKALEEIKQYRAIGTVEELKAFRSDDFTQDLLNMGYTKGYNKAIDKFAEAITAKLPKVEKDERVSKMACVADMIFLVDGVAEQMKAGADNE